MPMGKNSQRVNHSTRRNATRHESEFCLVSREAEAATEVEVEADGWADAARVEQVTALASAPALWARTGTFIAKNAAETMRKV